MDKTQIRDAATVILIRDRLTNPSVLMGQRGAAAAFMPNKFVFPGGAVDAGDGSIKLTAPITEPCNTRLSKESDQGLLSALPVAAIRELWEETGLVLGAPGAWPDAPSDWTTFAQTGHRPSAKGLKFVFRALTPPGRPRRFDARFFLADAAEVSNDLDDFSAASDELSHLQWIALDQVRGFDLPFITKVVIAEIRSRLDHISAPPTVPFFKNNDEESLFVQIGDPLDPKVQDQHNHAQ